MIEYVPHPILFDFGKLKIFSWGFMLAIGFIVGALINSRLAKEKGLDDFVIFDSIIYIMLASIIGARVLYFVVYPSEYSGIASLFWVWNGGMVSYGGFLFGMLALFLYAKIKKINAGKLFDSYAPGFAIGIAITVIGCFINWDDFGIESSLPWSIHVAGDVPRHPAQLYQFILLIIIFGVVWSIRNKKEVFGKKMVPGNLFLLFLMMYALERGVVDAVRDYEPAVRNASQTSMIFLFLVCITLFLYRSSSYKGGLNTKVAEKHIKESHKRVYEQKNKKYRKNKESSLSHKIKR